MSDAHGQIGPLLERITHSDLAAARSILSESGNPVALHAALADEAERLAVSDTNAALRATEILRQLADEAGDPAIRARIRRARGQALAYANRFQDALEVLDEARAIAGPARLEAARAGVAMIHALARLGRLREAAEIGERARAELLALNEQVLAARADVNLGVIARMLDRPQEAIEHFDRALPAFADNPVVAAQIQSNRGEALLDLSEFADAERAFAAALTAFEAAGAERAASIAEGNLADLLSRQGRYGKALHHFERARSRVSHDSAPADAARLAIEQAEAQFAVNLLQEAASTYEHTLPVLQQHGLAAEAARAMLGSAKVLSLMNRLDDAAERAEAARDEFARIGQEVPARRAQVTLGQIRIMQGQVAAGSHLVRSSLPQLDDRPADSAAAHALLADTALAAGDYRKALVECGIGLHLAERAGMVHLLPTLRAIRGRAYLAIDLVEEAIADLDGAAEEIARLRGTLAIDRFRAVFASGHADIAAHAVLAHLRVGSPEHVRRAFDLVQMAKGGSLLDLLQSESDAVGRHGDIADIQQASQRLRALVNQALERSTPASSRDDLPAKIAQAEQEIDALQAKLLSQSEYREIVSAPAALEEIQTQLPPGWLFLEFFIAGPELLVFAITRTDLEHRSLGAVQGILDPLAQLQFQFDRAIAKAAAGAVLPSPNSADAALEELFELLLRPFAARLDESRGLVVGPAGPLHRVPFHALRIQDRYLCQKLPTLQAPSASLLVHLAERAPASGMSRGPLIVAVPDEVAPGILVEAETLRQLMPEADVRLGAQATGDAVAAAAADRPLIHFACHGAFPPGMPGAAGLKLADGWFTARDIARLPLDGTIVSLSGCETGRSGVAASEELTGLSRSFVAAGAAAILATLTPTHDQTSAKLLGNVYSLWYALDARGGGSLATALQRVRTESIQSGIHPAFWSPFFVIGSP